MRVPFSWGGSAFHTYLSVIEGPMRQLLTVKNLPPPLFSEGNFITVHRDRDREEHNKKQWFPVPVPCSVYEQ